MIIHMKTTLILPEHIVRELKRRAARRGQTLSAIVAETLRRGLARPEREARPASLPVHHMGKPLVDIAE
jgi:plasmid stability protein